jgi:hypothetical protein
MTEMAGVGAGAEILAGDQAPHRRIERADARHDCANCGTHLTGPYCHQCGQKGHLHTRIWHMAEDFVEGVMHFDGRLWRTLPLLTFRPGRLSRAWIEGKRVRYVAPLHIFLFSIFLFFLSLSLSGGQIFTKVFEAMAKDDVVAVPATSVDVGRTKAPVVTQGDLKVTVEQETCSDPELRGIGRALCRARDHISENPKYYAYKAETSTYKAAPLLAPITMAILALLLIFKRGYTLYDHGVVALYGLSFLSLATTLSIVLNAIAPGDWPLVVFLASAVHATLHLRGAYKLSWFGAIARMVLLGFFMSNVIGLFLFAVAAMSAA